MKDSDRTQKLGIVAATAQRLLDDKRGIVAIHRAIINAQAGPRSANLEPHRGDRYEIVQTVEGPMRARIPTNDPTGEASLEPDVATVAATRLDKLLNQADNVMRDLLAMQDEWLPKQGADKPTEEGPGEDWCRSCWRDNKHCEPACDRYAGLCRWCGDFRAVHKTDPPMPILRARHRGERITTAMVDRYRRAG